MYHESCSSDIVRDRDCAHLHGGRGDSKICKQKGYKCKVEKQGALGIEDKLRDRDIKEADLIVFANDVGITKAERFTPYQDKIFQTKPHAVIKDPSIIFSEVEE